MVNVSVHDLDQVQKLILYILNNDGNIPVGETHIQKMMFQTMSILGKDPKLISYEPNSYGPYSILIDEKKRSLQETGYLEEKGGRYRISPNAESEVSRIKPPSESIGFRLSKMSRYLASLDEDELLLLIYVDDLNYNEGEYLERSDVKSDILGRRRDIATRMYLDKKVSLERASELSGLNLSDYQNFLQRSLGRIYVD